MAAAHRRAGRASLATGISIPPRAMSMRKQVRLPGHRAATFAVHKASREPKVCRAIRGRLVRPAQPGEVWFTSAGAPAGATGIVGDWHLNSTTGDYSKKTGASTWTVRGNLRGPQGIQGPAGPSTGPAGGVLSGTYPNPGMAAGAAATNVGTLGGVLGGTLPSPTMAAGAAATNVGALGGVLGGTLPNPTMAAGAAATNVGTLGGSLSGTLPNPTLAANSVGASQITDGTVGTAELANANVTNAKLASDTARANLLTNGGFEIWQRGNGPFTLNGATASDRWYLAFNGTDTMSVARDTANVDIGSIAAAAITFVKGNGVNALWRQDIRRTDGAQFWGRMMSASVRVRTSVAGAVQVRLSCDGTGAISPILSTFHTGSGTYETLSATIAVPADGTLLAIGLLFSASCTAYIDNAMLVVGSVAADYAPLHPADDLARCLRYYETMGTPPLGDVIVNGIATAGGQTIRASLPLRQFKPVIPTVTVTGTWGLTNASGQPTADAIGDKVIRLAVNSTAAGLFFAVNANVNTYVLIEANP